MRILYGVVGEGMGHATRSQVVCEHLVARGHEVKIVVSGRAHAFLSRAFRDVVEIRGLTIRYVDNRMDRDGTLAQNVLAAPGLIATNVSAYFDKVARFRPHVVISDFDSFAYLFAKRHGVPILSIDNQQIISRCKLGKFAKQGARVDYQMIKAFVRAKLPGCDHYVITSFFQPPIRKKYAKTTTLVPPILRRPILEAKSSARAASHVLVYQTSTSDGALLDELARVKGVDFVVYGLRKNGVRGNCVLKEFSEQGFVADLASARAVVCNGGLSLIGEALYLGKPIFSVPVHNQYEQLLNARYLEEMGYGLCADRIQAELLRLFLSEAHKYAGRVARHRQDGNQELFCAVDRLLERFARDGRKRKEKGADA
ncbi:MAG TPA: MJ1255/VC2487 family glycosyltransferase [Polyangiaceae bacterium]|nr:MJ1255/VC2487 family glycosyltransferase [Polyangiaceae bacterium]